MYLITWVMRGRRRRRIMTIRVAFWDKQGNSSRKTKREGATHAP